MAEITRKGVGELQRGVFKILLNFPDGLPAVFEGCEGRTSGGASRLICQDIEGRYS
jgi:hypothetical protein